MTPSEAFTGWNFSESDNILTIMYNNHSYGETIMVTFKGNTMTWLIEDNDEGDYYYARKVCKKL